MIEEQAVIVDVDGTRAHLEIRRMAPCGLCGSTQGCGISLWGRLFKRSNNGFWASNDLQAKVGDFVIIGIQEGALLAGSLTAYLLPLIFVCVGALIGGSMAATRTSSDFFAVAGAIGGLFLALVWMKIHTGQNLQNGRYAPVMLRHGELVSIRRCSR